MIEAAAGDRRSASPQQGPPKRQRVGSASKNNTNESIPDTTLDDSPITSTTKKPKKRRGRGALSPIPPSPPSGTTANPNISSNASNGDGTIRCICVTCWDDGQMVQCDACQTWQHTRCYKIDFEALNNDESAQWICVVCEPGRWGTGLDAEWARMMQKKEEERERQANMNKLVNSSQATRGRKRRITITGAAIGADLEEKEDPKPPEVDDYESWKRVYVPISENIIDSKDVKQAINRFLSLYGADSQFCQNHLPGSWKGKGREEEPLTNSIPVVISPKEFREILQGDLVQVRARFVPPPPPPSTTPTSNEQQAKSPNNTRFRSPQAVRQRSPGAPAPNSKAGNGRSRASSNAPVQESPQERWSYGNMFTQYQQNPQNVHPPPPTNYPSQPVASQISNTKTNPVASTSTNANVRTSLPAPQQQYTLHLSSELEVSVPPRTLLTLYHANVSSHMSYFGAPVNQYYHLGVPKQSVRIFGPPLEVVLDSRIVGGIARFARSGCWPNAVLRTIVVKSKGKGKSKPTRNKPKKRGRPKVHNSTQELDEDIVMYLDQESPEFARRSEWPEGDDDGEELQYGLFAIKEIQPGDEIVLPWEWDDAHRIHRLPRLLLDELKGASSVFGPRTVDYYSILSKSLADAFPSCACVDDPTVSDTCYPINSLPREPKRCCVLREITDWVARRVQERVNGTSRDAPMKSLFGLGGNESHFHREDDDLTEEDEVGRNGGGSWNGGLTDLGPQHHTVTRDSTTPAPERHGLSQNPFVPHPAYPSHQPVFHHNHQQHPSVSRIQESGNQHAPPRPSSVASLINPVNTPPVSRPTTAQRLLHRPNKPLETKHLIFDPSVLVPRPNEDDGAVLLRVLGVSLGPLIGAKRGVRVEEYVDGKSANSVLVVKGYGRVTSGDVRFGGGRKRRVEDDDVLVADKRRRLQHFDDVSEAVRQDEKQVSLPFHMRRKLNKKKRLTLPIIPENESMQLDDDEGAGSIHGAEATLNFTFTSTQLSPFLTQPSGHHDISSSTAQPSDSSDHRHHFNNQPEIIVVQNQVSIISPIPMQQSKPSTVPQLFHSNSPTPSSPHRPRSTMSIANMLNSPAPPEFRRSPLSEKKDIRESRSATPSYSPVTSHRSSAPPVEVDSSTPWSSAIIQEESRNSMTPQGVPPRSSTATEAHTELSPELNEEMRRGLSVDSSDVGRKQTPIPMVFQPVPPLDHSWNSPRDDHAHSGNEGHIDEKVDGDVATPRAMSEDPIMEVNQNHSNYGVGVTPANDTDERPNEEPPDEDVEMKARSLSPARPSDIPESFDSPLPAHAASASVESASVNTIVSATRESPVPTNDEGGSEAASLPTIREGTTPADEFSRLEISSARGSPPIPLTLDTSVMTTASDHPPTTTLEEDSHRLPTPQTANPVRRRTLKGYAARRKKVADDTPGSISLASGLFGADGLVSPTVERAGFSHTEGQGYDMQSTLGASASGETLDSAQEPTESGFTDVPSVNAPETFIKQETVPVLLGMLSPASGSSHHLSSPTLDDPKPTTAQEIEKLSQNSKIDNDAPIQNVTGLDDVPSKQSPNSGSPRRNSLSYSLGEGNVGSLKSDSLGLKPSVRPMEDGEIIVSRPTSPTSGRASLGPSYRFRGSPRDTRSDHLSRQSENKDTETDKPRGDRRDLPTQPRSFGHPNGRYNEQRPESHSPRRSPSSPLSNTRRSITPKPVNGSQRPPTSSGRASPPTGPRSGPPPSAPRAFRNQGPSWQGGPNSGSSYWGDRSRPRERDRDLDRRDERDDRGRRDGESRRGYGWPRRGK